MSGSLAVAICMLAFNSVALADCTDEIVAIKESAEKLRCAKDGGKWPDWTPIWQKKAGKGRIKQGEVGDGCEVHLSLARLLYELRDPDRNSPPHKKRGNNVARGAAHALADGQFQYAVDLLEEFQLSIATSVINPDFTVVEDKDGIERTAEWYATAWSLWADKMQARIDPVAGVCST